MLLRVSPNAADANCSRNCVISLKMLSILNKVNLKSLSNTTALEPETKSNDGCSHESEERDGVCAVDFILLLNPLVYTSYWSNNIYLLLI